MPTMLNIVPIRICSVRSARIVPIWMPFGMTSYPSYWKWCSVSQNESNPSLSDRTPMSRIRSVASHTSLAP